MVKSVLRENCYLNVSSPVVKSVLKEYCDLNVSSLVANSALKECCDLNRFKPCGKECTDDVSCRS